MAVRLSCKILMTYISKILLLLVTFTVASNNFAQQNYNKTFFCTKSYYYHFRGESLNNVQYINQSDFVSNSDKIKGNLALLVFNQIDFEYQKTYDNDNGLLFSLGIYYADHSSKSILITKKGEASLRTFVKFNASYLKSIYQKNHQHLRIKAGLNFRAGEEVLFAGYYKSLFFTGKEYVDLYESYFVNKTLLDLGVNLGLRYQFDVGKRLALASEFSYTFYPLVYDKKDPVYNWNSGPSRHVLQLSLALGFGFGKKMVQ